MASDKKRESHHMLTNSKDSRDRYTLSIVYTWLLACERLPDFSKRLFFWCDGIRVFDDCLTCSAHFFVTVGLGQLDYDTDLVHHSSVEIELNLWQCQKVLCCLDLGRERQPTDNLSGRLTLPAS